MNRYPLIVKYCRKNKNLHRRVIRFGHHTISCISGQSGGVLAASEKEARLMLIDDYNRRGLRVLQIIAAKPAPVDEDNDAEE